jgi:hypothetical protein
LEVNGDLLRGVIRLPGRYDVGLERAEDLQLRDLEGEIAGHHHVGAVDQELQALDVGIVSSAELGERGAADAVELLRVDGRVERVLDRCILPVDGACEHVTRGGRGPKAEGARGAGAQLEVEDGELARLGRVGALGRERNAHWLTSGAGEEDHPLPPVGVHVVKRQWESRACGAQRDEAGHPPTVGHPHDVEKRGSPKVLGPDDDFVGKAVSVQVSQCHDRRAKVLPGRKRSDWQAARTVRDLMDQRELAVVRGGNNEH